MYNKGSYNRGKYNVSAGNAQVSGFAALAVISDYAVANVIHDAPKTTADITWSSIGRQTSEIYAVQTAAEIVANASGEGVRGLFGISDSETDIIFSTGGEFSVGVFAPAVDGEVVINAGGAAVRALFAVSLGADVAVKTSGQSARAVFAKETAVDVIFSGTGAATRYIFANKPDGANTINLNASGAADIYGYSVISLPGLVLPVNGEIVIDTELMTVTLNNQDVTRYFSPESEFFKLKPGENLVLYEDGVANRNVSYKILWKDMYL